MSIQLCPPQPSIATESLTLRDAWLQFRKCIKAERRERYGSLLDNNLWAAQLSRPVSAITDTEAFAFHRELLKHGDRRFADDSRRLLKMLVKFGCRRLDAPTNIHPITASSSPTLRAVWNEYKALRNLKPSTLTSYDKHLHHYLVKWLDMPVDLITEQEVIDTHTAMSESLSGATANGSMRVARALFQFAIARHKLDLQNPVKILSNLRIWKREKKRTGHIPEHAYAEWYQLVLREKSDTLRDLLRFLLLGGLRRQEACELKWSNVDLRGAVFTLEDTKNNDDVTLPISSVSLALLKRRRSEHPHDDYVFATIDGKAPYSVPFDAIKRIESGLGFPFSPHDLRRCFLTVGDSLDIQLHTLKKLANHRTGGDVTLRYIQSNPERLREPAEKIGKRIAELWGVQEEFASSQPECSMPDTRINDRTALIGTISRSEREVLAYLVAGYSNRAIAGLLNKSPRAVEASVSRLQHKLLGRESRSVASYRTLLAVEAIRRKLVDVSPQLVRSVWRDGEISIERSAEGWKNKPLCQSSISLLEAEFASITEQH